MNSSLNLVSCIESNFFSITRVNRNIFDPLLYFHDLSAEYEDNEVVKKFDLVEIIDIKLGTGRSVVSDLPLSIRLCLENGFWNPWEQNSCMPCLITAPYFLTA